MTDFTLKTLDGGTRSLTAKMISTLRADLTGPLLLPGDEGYDKARSVWNAMIDKRPALIACCADANDVAAVVNFARQTDALISIKGGGHNIAGNAVTEGGLMIDLSAMNNVDVNPTTHRVQVGPGATLADLDAATTPYGLAVPVGINSTTGIAGLTLGGGFGWLTRAHGLTIDSLVAADVVTADGARLRATADENPDLFWALRGGGGNFGVITRFEFQARVVRSNLLCGLLFLPLERARELFALQRELMEGGPEELTTWMVVRNAPPMPFLPEESHGTGIAMMAFCYAGEPEDGEASIAPLRAVSSPLALLAGIQPFAEFQQIFDPLLIPGARNYWKSHDLLELPDTAVEALIEAVDRLPDAETEIFVAHVGGALSLVAPHETAFVQRRPHYVVNIHTRWQDPAKDDAARGWARGLFEALSPYSAGVYVNFMPAEESARVAEAYGANYARLTAVKACYDPENRFRLNQNILPDAEVQLAG
ncbi:FAD-binding oxidoreductase [Vreelandella boliviensis]|uniref:FAD-binding oxidoreductase n=1 Tax=Vreelandella boliviensis TaxID=223527 RepID=UPI0020163815|nr:FAD-binding oxidoreductase [Halomonas boliviensis]